MREAREIEIVEERRLLVKRILTSPHFVRSVRLKDLLHYLTERVLEDEAGEIREQEVGHNVFGRPANYDTTADNIVRVHASMLRKRLEQYFAVEGVSEPVIVEIPKGNYAPVFHERPQAVLSSEPVLHLPAEAPSAPRTDRNWLIWVVAAATVLFAATTLWLFLGRTPAPTVQRSSRPVVALFWSQVFMPNRPTDLVLDDGAIALYQELTGKEISLSAYFDRSYLRSLGDEPASALILRRQSSYANSSFLWKLMQMPESTHWRDVPRFARDYSFRELKANNAILLGNSRTNPWIQAFESKTGIRWRYDKSGAYYPVGIDTKDGRESYCSVTLLPNLGGTGNVVIVSATGGSAMNGAADFLGDEHSLAGLRGKLPGSPDSRFPYFEALISVAGRNGLSRSSSVVMARPLK